jgi:hypothetical protein
MELNPLLGDRPSLSKLIVFKNVVNYYIDPASIDPQLLKELNMVLGLVVINNRHVKNKNK